MFDDMSCCPLSATSMAHDLQAEDQRSAVHIASAASPARCWCGTVPR